MKEATGELSTTVITVVAIAAISSLFIVFLYPQLKSSIILNQACGNGPGYKYQTETASGASAYGVECTGDTSGNTWTCFYKSGSNALPGTTAGGGVQSKTCNREN